jgi:DNA processing protein
MNSPDLALSRRERAAAWLRLTLVPGVTPGAQRALLAAFGSPEEALASPRHRLVALIDSEPAGLLLKGPEPALLEKTLAWIEQPGNHLLTLNDPAYPAMIREIDDPPAVLYAVGRVELLQSQGLAIVGSRNATPQGARDAEEFARDLSNAGLCIVSGLALGIDAAAHRGALEGAASTIAVMGTGADRLYPPRNRALGRRIGEHGCLLTEFALGTAPLSGNFPRRNRLISGLARGVLVVEGATRSGSLVTARSAIDQNREVFAMPGSIHSPQSKGCHHLIKEGAKLAECAEDILVELGLAKPGDVARHEPMPLEPHPLLDEMGFDPVTVDQLANRTGRQPAAICAGLSQLEIEGRIAAIPGGWFQQVKAGA